MIGKIIWVCISSSSSCPSPPLPATCLSRATCPTWVILTLGPVTSLLIFGNSGFACMLVAVMQRPRLRQCTSHRLEWRTRLRSRFYIDGTGFIDFCEKLKYLGSMLHYSLTSDADVDKRITSATAAFGALKNIFADKYLSEELKG